MSSTDHNSDAHNPEYDPMDPHGFHSGETHGHHIVSLRMLVTVLVLLFIFTFLTVASSRAEVWVAETFDVEIPQSVNVLVAMSIATIKGVLVALFFMQLLYDKTLNAVIFCFCLMGFALFLGFTALDAAHRGRIDPVKQNAIVVGGIGNVSRPKLDAEGNQVYDEYGRKVMETVPANTPIAEFAKNPEVAISRLGEKRYEKLVAKHEAEHAHHAETSTEEQSRPNYGLMLFGQDHSPSEAPSAGGH